MKLSKITFSILVMLLGIFILTGCQKTKSSWVANKYPDTTITEAGYLPLGFGPPACIAWYRPVPETGKWEIYKTVSSAEQIFEIINLLRTDVHEMFKFKNIEDYPNSRAHAEAFKGDQMLSFIYHMPKRKLLTVQNMEIKISKGKLVWPAGQSADIYKIFEKQKEWNYQELMDEQYYKRHGYYPGENTDDTDLPLGESPFMQMKQPADI